VRHLSHHTAQVVIQCAAAPTTGQMKEELWWMVPRQTPHPHNDYWDPANPHHTIPKRSGRSTFVKLRKSYRKISNYNKVLSLTLLILCTKIKI